MADRARAAAAGTPDPIAAALNPPATPATIATARPSFPAGANPGGLLQPPTGGKALASMMHRENYGGLAPTNDELTSATPSPHRTPAPT